MNRRENSVHRQAFETFYGNGRAFGKTAESCGVSDATVRNWAEWFGWHARADARDREAAKKAEREAINRRARKLAEHQRLGELMRRRSEEHFRKHEIADTGDAIRAAKEGIAIERAAEGLPTEILELLSYDSEALYAERERLLRRLQAADGPAPDREAGEAELAPAGEADEPEGDEARSADALRRPGEPEASPVPEPDL